MIHSVIFRKTNIEKRDKKTALIIEVLGYVPLFVFQKMV